jgi:hypothetical protein
MNGAKLNKQTGWAGVFVCFVVSAKAGVELAGACMPAGPTCRGRVQGMISIAPPVPLHAGMQKDGRLLVLSNPFCIL